MKGKITVSLALTREEVKKALIEAGIEPTTRRMEDAISFIRNTCADWAGTALIEYTEKHVDYVHLEKKDWE